MHAHDEHAAPVQLLEQLDVALGEAAVIDVDPAESIRADRDERDARDAERAESG